ncbi:hypothetical protein PHYSODRAFT_285803 [Phytophthora sojae]|uniref:RxLR effector protein n=2 Tax=Phytophthora sojae TaxID=67593 RepID=G4ZF80_PHYSP|nr:hypothetical protein PHYSODRAFT_285803 [Phytophthora sojae]AEK80807.1 Avh166 [Phytophthora sojae]AEK80808.1 Avh166 [Phytophthora sojae]AEK80809.1 Avh166 [Phytophthora sojae]EGZ16583.1 hypothetical protein PHYSODRAFT_285803 [Phytophthora sojae]|eukprot:XP_009525641.1 hypothetical protein PHYSODRAFT_285803 [Phytophthora sojae]
MRRFFLVLLVVALFTVVDAALTTSVRKLTTLSTDLPGKRLLRIETKRGKDSGGGEEEGASDHCSWPVEAVKG